MMKKREKMKIKKIKREGKGKRKIKNVKNKMKKKLETNSLSRREREKKNLMTFFLVLSSKLSSNLERKKRNWFLEHFPYSWDK